jgi:hypothetical protein
MLALSSVCRPLAYLGFRHALSALQVDLVESPNAILRNIKSGTYQVNYAVLNNPQLPMAPAGQLSQHLGRLGNSSLNTDILEVLGSKANVAEFAGGEESLTVEWFKTIFEHSDGTFSLPFTLLPVPTYSEADVLPFFAPL